MKKYILAVNYTNKEDKECTGIELYQFEIQRGSGETASNKVNEFIELLNQKYPKYTHVRAECRLLGLIETIQEEVDRQ
jgi:hypothetical protein